MTERKQQPKTPWWRRDSKELRRLNDILGDPEHKDETIALLMQMPRKWLAAMLQKEAVNDGNAKA